MFEVAQLRGQKVARYPRARERGTGAQGLRQLPAGDLDRRLQFGEPGQSQPALGAESVPVGGNQLAQGSEARERVACQIERRAPAGSSAQQYGQQFRVGQRTGALVEQLLAGSFVDGPIANCHEGEHDGRPGNSLAAFRWRAGSYRRRALNCVPSSRSRRCRVEDQVLTEG